MANPPGSPTRFIFRPLHRVSLWRRFGFTHHHQHHHHVIKYGMNPSHYYAESIEPTTKLYRDTAPCARKNLTHWGTFFLSLSKSVQELLVELINKHGCAVRVFFWEKPYRRRAPSRPHIGRKGRGGGHKCHLHGNERPYRRDGEWCTCRTKPQKCDADRPGEATAARGFVGYVRTSGTRACLMAMARMIVCESLVARNRVMRSTSLHRGLREHGRLMP